MVQKYTADAKQAKELSTHNFFSNHAAIVPELDRIACMEDFFKYTEMSIAPRGKSTSFEVFQSPFCIGKKKSDEYIIFFLRNRGSEKERVAEDMAIREVRKCSRLLTPVNSLIDQLHHCVVGTC